MYRIAWKINPHMQIGKASSALAVEQHRAFTRNLAAAGARVIEVPFVHGAFDSVFIKDSLILREDGDGRGRALLSKPRTPERRSEQAPRSRALAASGIRVAGGTKMHFEGGDLVMLPRGREALLGYGFRSQWRAAREIETFLDRRITTLHLVDPNFYHLDVALNVVETDEGLVAFAIEEAFSPESWLKLNRLESLSRVVTVSRDEAMHFALNWVEVGHRLFVGAPAPRLAAQLAAYGREVVVSPLDQFNLAGGSAACLVARVHVDGSGEQSYEKYEVGGHDRHEHEPRHHGGRPAHAKHAHQRAASRKAN